jgi:O-antigen/teichoic acid export membrane protein
MSKTFKNTIIYVLLGFISPAINFILIPLYTNYLSPEQYGIITISVVFQAILNIVIGLGLVGTYHRFYYDYDDQKSINSLFDTCISINILTTIFLSLGLFFYGDLIFKDLFETTEFTMNKYGWWVVLTAISGIIQNFILAEYRNKEEAGKYSIYSFLFFIATVIGVFIGVVVLKANALGSIIGRSIGISIPIFIYLLFVYKNRKFEIQYNNIGKLLNYGYPIMIYATLTFLYNNSDRVIISKYLNTSTLGLYGFAMSIAAVCEIMANAMNNTFMPKINKMMKDVDDIVFLKEIKLQFSYIFIMMLIVIVSLIAFTMPGIKYFINNKYHETIIWMPLIYIAYISRVYYIVYSFPIFYYKKTKVLIPITVLTLIITVVVSILLLPKLGVFALIIVLFFSNATQVISIIIYNKKVGIYNDYLYSFKSIHIQYLFIIGLVLVGYLLYYDVFNENIDYFIYYNLVVWGASVLLMLKMNPEYYNRFMQILKSKLRLSPNK